jgi:hypothetical protein
MLGKKAGSIDCRWHLAEEWKQSGLEIGPVLIERAGYCRRKVERDAYETEPASELLRLHIDAEVSVTQPAFH